MTRAMSMLSLALCFLSILASAPASAQEATPEPAFGDDYALQVFVDSAFTRALPSRDAEFTASVFENDVLYAIGRNADGTWFQVKRPNRDTILGWLPRNLVGFTFEVGLLPITDFTTGVIGPTPVYDSGVSVLVLSELNLRADPFLDGEVLAVVPVFATVPAIERSPDNVWLYINYLGYAGWVAEFLTRPTTDIDSLPISPIFFGAGFEIVPLPIIPPEVQLAQVSRMRDYITPQWELAASIANFWQVVLSGEVAPCVPPEGEIGGYRVTTQDLFELPELGRYVSRLQRAVNDLNRSIATMQRCGVYSAEEINTAYAQAVNAGIIFEALLDQLDYLETFVIPGLEE